MKRNWLIERCFFARELKGHWSFTVVSIIWGLMGAAVLLRDNLMSTLDQRKYATLALLPKWPWYVWVIGLLTILLLMIFESAYQSNGKLQNEGEHYREEIENYKAEAERQKSELERFKTQASRSAVSAAAGLPQVVISPTFTQSVGHQGNQKLSQRTASVSSKSEKIRPEPNIQRGDIRCGSIQLQGGIFTDDINPKMSVARCVLLQIRNDHKSENQLVGYADVKGQLVFCGPNEEEFRASPCAWLEESDSDPRIEVGESAWIVAAVGPKNGDDWLAITNRHVSGVYPSNDKDMHYELLPVTEQYYPLALSIISAPTGGDGKLLKTFKYQWRMKLGDYLDIKPL